MGAYAEKDFTIDGRQLREGDTISFTAFQDILDQAVEPDVFSNLRQIKLENRKEEANKAVDPTPDSAPRDSGGSSEG